MPAVLAVAPDESIHVDSVIASRPVPATRPRPSTHRGNRSAPKPSPDATTSQIPSSPSGHAAQPWYASPESAPAPHPWYAPPESAPATSRICTTISQSAPTTPQKPTNTPQAGDRMG